MCLGFVWTQYVLGFIKKKRLYFLHLVVCKPVWKWMPGNRRNVRAAVVRHLENTGRGAALRCPGRLAEVAQVRGQ